MKGKGGVLRLIATAGVAVFGGVLGLSIVSSVALRGFQTLVETKRKKTAASCDVCLGRGFVKCRLCKGTTVIDWSPLLDPVVPRPCLCPSCDGNTVQRCLNCTGRGYA